jgi:peptidoglycan hydrolase-like protein with peptidoglycan-binding domain
MKTRLYKIKNGVAVCSLILLASACGLNPQNADLDLNNTLPEAKHTVYQDAVRKLGFLSTVYGRQPLKIMSKNISDNTGTSVATNAEIPRDITEMVKSTLNAIGGNLTFIPYDPDFFANSVNTGYSEFTEKLIPDVVVSGGITEFDRGLVTKGDSAEIEGTFGDFGLSYEDENKGSLAQVTLDFNMIDFKTLAGIPRIQAVNGIKLHKAIKEDSFAFTVKSVTLGAKGTIKKVQGRHSAVRLLVELSMVQLLGRYQALPYWRLLPGGQRDEVVIDRVLSDFYDLSERGRVAAVQKYLYLHGYEVSVNGIQDSKTKSALEQFTAKQGLADANINQNLFLALYENVPIDYATRARSKMLASLETDYSNMEVTGSVFIQEEQPTVAQVDEGNLTLWTDKKEYNIGEIMQISFSVDQPMFVRLVVINSKGEVSTLFPNVYQSDNYCKPGVTYQIPPTQAQFTLDIGGPTGTDRIRAVASRTPIAADALHFTESGEFNLAKMPKLPVRAEADIFIR